MILRPPQIAVGAARPAVVHTPAAATLTLSLGAPGAVVPLTAGATAVSLSGPHIETDPGYDWVSYSYTGYDLGATLGMLVINTVTTAACQVMYRVNYDKVSYISTKVNGDELSPHAESITITNPLHRGVPLDLYWRHRVAGGSWSLYQLMATDAVLVPEYGGVPTYGDGDNP